ncbi:MAG: 50S ribosomal protein L18 [Planctomycetota bacterium]|nr:50S ribosomal protein L18 [Planctomycetota bacterium]
MDAMKRKQWLLRRRKLRVRKKIYGTLTRPRLSVYRSLRHIYAQLIDDEQGRSLLMVSSLCPEMKGQYGGNVAAAKKVGALLAQRAKERGISQVVFDRNGRKYHGRIKALAEAAREGGLRF